MLDVPYRFHQFEPPTVAPFDQDDCWWPTVVGEFFRPLVCDQSVEAFVFLNHRRAQISNIELQFASSDYARIEEEMGRLMQRFSINRTAGPTDGHIVGDHAYRGTRWISDQRNQVPDDARRRSEKVFRFLHGGCALYLDSLIQDGPRWRMESNSNGENPHHNLFESQLHLVSNFSDVQFDIFLVQTGQGVAAATAWMLPAGVVPLAHIGKCKL